MDRAIIKGWWCDIGGQGEEMTPDRCCVDTYLYIDSFLSESVRLTMYQIRKMKLHTSNDKYFTSPQNIIYSIFSF